MRPASGVSNPAIMRRSVVLPQPEGPSRVKNSPASMLKSTRSTAGMVPAKMRETPDMVIAPRLAAAGSGGVGSERLSGITGTPCCGLWSMGNS
jgi:hypothetical protein